MKWLQISMVQTEVFLELAERWGIGLSVLRSFFESKKKYAIHIRRRAICIFCMNEGPRFRSLDIVADRQHAIEALGNLDHYQEVTGLVIHPRYRGTLYSSLCWICILYFVLRGKRNRLLYISADPRITEHYRLTGLSPIYTGIGTHLGKTQIASLFTCRKGLLPLCLARAILIRHFLKITRA
jgi:hypothetical protein